MKKTRVINFRATEEDLDKLELLSKQLNITKSEVISSTVIEKTNSTPGEKRI